MSMPDFKSVLASPLGAPPETQRMAAALLPLMYEDLRRIARRERLRVRAGGTLQTTALIHEAYLKLHNMAEFNDREHLLRASALAMRHILVNHARDRMAGKRGGGVPDIAMDDAPEVGAAPDEAVIEINEALERLAELSPRLAQVVECRFFAGYDDVETAAALGLTDRTRAPRLGQGPRLAAAGVGGPGGQRGRRCAMNSLDRWTRAESEQWTRIEAALDEILALPDSQWAAACARIGGDDVRLREEISTLLACAGGEDAILDRPLTVLSSVPS